MVGRRGLYSALLNSTLLYSTPPQYTEGTHLKEDGGQIVVPVQSQARKDEVKGPEGAQGKGEAEHRMPRLHSTPSVQCFSPSNSSCATRQKIESSLSPVPVLFHPPG